MRLRIAVALMAIPLAACVWLVLASMAIITAFGFWSIYPWPGKGWMWLRYLIEAPPNTIVHRWLWITGVVPLLPLLAVGALLWRQGRDKTKRPALYSTAEFANRSTMTDNGIKTSRRLSSQ